LLRLLPSTLSLLELLRPSSSQFNPLQRSFHPFDGVGGSDNNSLLHQRLLAERMWQLERQSNYYLFRRPTPCVFS
jgi:hypothetical protein